MKSIHRVFLIVLCAALALPVAVVTAQPDPDALAGESEAACVASASTKPTPQMIVDKVNKAGDLLQKEGKAAFPKFKGKDSEFIFAGTYIWVHDLSGTMRMHPIKYKMEGRNYIDLKDPNGKLFFTVMNEVAKSKGSGWVEYMWPKPGEKKASLKVSYVKLCKVDGEDMVIGCGVYDMSPDDIKKLLK